MRPLPFGLFMERRTDPVATAVKTHRSTAVGRGPARAARTRRRRGIADHRAFRPSDHRLRTRWRAPRSAVRVLPFERGVQRHAAGLRHVPHHRFRCSMRRRRPRRTFRAPTTARPATTPSSFRPDVHFDHADVMGSCVSCHNGSIAEGEGPTHPATSQNCAACHTVISWNPPKLVDHTQIPLSVAGFCIICHNGTQAAGKPAGHIATNLECGDCHLTTTWTGATFDHTGITSRLRELPQRHQGGGQTGQSHAHHQSVRELPHHRHRHQHTELDAIEVRSHTDDGDAHAEPVTAVRSRFRRDSSRDSRSITSRRFPSAVDCGVCHGNTPAAETWTVLAASIPMLHAGLNVANCVLCHGGRDLRRCPCPVHSRCRCPVYRPPRRRRSRRRTSRSSPAPIAAACHGAAYQAGGFGPATAMSAAKHAFVIVRPATPAMTRARASTSAPARRCSCGRPITRTATIPGWRPATARCATRPRTGSAPRCRSGICRIRATWPARTCHASAPSDYTPATLAANSVLHTGIAGNCGLCHGNNVAALTWSNKFTPKDALLTPAAHPVPLRYRL